jgi:acetylornithine deacetylase
MGARLGAREDVFSLSRVVDHLSQLIRIPSVSSLSNRPVVAYAVAVLQPAGWTTREIAYIDERGLEKVNLIAAPPGQSAMQREVDLAFFCHTDTVPYAPDWNQALDPVRIGDMMHGCGACDVKGFLACLLAAAEAEKERLQRQVRIVLTADEEIGCVGSKRLLAMDCLVPRRLVIGEPTSLHPARAGKGYCLARVSIDGKEAHSAHPEQGVSAIYAAARLISRIEELSRELQQERHPFFAPGYTTLNVGTVSGGTAKNIIPGHAEFLVEWRPVPGQSSERVSSAVRSFLRQAEHQLPGLRASFELLRDQAGFETAADRSLVTILEEFSGQEPSSIAFGSEASVWSTVSDEIVVFGPGDMRTAHSSRECVAIPELESAVEIVRRLIRSE